MILNVEASALLKLNAGAEVSSSQIIANISIEIGEDSMIGAGCLICDSDMHEVPLGSGKPTAVTPIRIERTARLRRPLQPRANFKSMASTSGRAHRRLGLYTIQHEEKAKF